MTATGTAEVSAVREALGAAVDGLAAAGVDDPRLDAEVLLAEATGLDRAELVASPEAEVPPAAGRRFGEMVRRRLRREPVAYILGRKGFRRLDLAVDRRVLVPRPETELLVDVALELRPATVLDVGTGSGAIALAIADELPRCKVTATDTSADALDVARANAERLGLSNRIRFLNGALPGAEARDRPETFDLIVANLPYVPAHDWPSLQPEIRDWEPREALLAGPDGLDAYRTFFPALEAGGCHSSRIAGGMTTTRLCVAVEVGEGQALAVAELAREAGFAETEMRRDLAGVERVVVGRRDPAPDRGAVRGGDSVSDAAL